MAILRQLVSRATRLWRDLPHHTAAKATVSSGAIFGRSAIKTAVRINRDLAVWIGTAPFLTLGMKAYANPHLCTLESGLGCRRHGDTSRITPT